MIKNLLSALVLLTSFASLGQVNPLNRPKDPVVLSGANLTKFSALRPSSLVGFKYVQGTWVQIPIQVDERALLDIATPYGPMAAGVGVPLSPTNPKIYFYTDPATFIGVDPNASFDSDDELVFMAQDAGEQFTGTTYPTGIVAGNNEQITIKNPSSGGLGYIYLFQSAGSLLPDAGIKYVNYSSNLASTAGFPANKTGVNLENTQIRTAFYTWHFSAEWVSDEMKILTGNNTDILDRHKNFFADGKCIRDEDIFSARENAYITCKAGPIRVIRSYMGAVSGPLTQRTHFFYQGRHDVATDLRVHNIASINDAFDYNPAALNMTYRNNLNTNGVVINGVQDKVNRGELTWEQVSGTPGTVSMVHSKTTTLKASEATFSSYYDDNKSRPASNCTGDGQAWGTSGVGIKFLNTTVCTDPLGSGCGVASVNYRTLQSRITVYADAPNAAPTTASDYYQASVNPLQVSFGTNATAASARKVMPSDGVIPLNGKVILYPNPAQGLVRIRYSLAAAQEVSISLHDVMGQTALVKKVKATKGENETKLDVAPLKKGVYFLNFYEGNTKQLSKLVVE